MAYDQTVVSSIRRKTAEGFNAPVFFSVEPQRIKALLNSHNNNLEEQSILGNDCITVEWTDEDNIIHSTKKYYDGTNKGNGYYILFSVDTINSKVDSNFYFENEYFRLQQPSTESPERIQYYFIDDEEGVPTLVSNDEIFTFDNGVLKINPGSKIIRTDVLCYRNNLINDSDEQSDDDILISQKFTYVYHDSDNKTTTKEIITNYLE